MWCNIWNMLRFYILWIKTALKSSLGIADLLSGIIAAIFAAWVYHHPESGWDMNSLAWQIPLVIFATIGVIRFFLAPYWIWKAAQDRLSLLEKPVDNPLRIIFDAKNPERRFWSLENTPNPNDHNKNYPPHWEYRIEIENTSNKTIKNVRVTKEHIGQLPTRAEHQLFDITKTPSYDIHPKCKALVPIITWPEPKIQVGKLQGASAWAYGPIRITASGDDIEPTTRLFLFNWQEEQMLFD